MPRSHYSVEFETLRLKTGLSRAETANLLGVTEHTVIRYENGESRPSPIAFKWLQEHLAILSTGPVRVSMLGSRIDWSDCDNSRESARVISVAASNAKSRKFMTRGVATDEKRMPESASVTPLTLVKNVSSKSWELTVSSIGVDTPVSMIDRDRCRDFRDLLNQLPANLRKLFSDRRVTFDHIVLEAKNQKRKLLARPTQDVYFNFLKRLLRFAKSEGYIDKYPADDLVPLAKKSSAREARDPFSIEQLNSIFKAPLYRGCENDQSGYAVKGPNVIRGTRFWIPLVALFTGMRLNEICQLDVTDIRQSDGGTWFIAVNDDGPDKSLKTDHSKREIPLHPDLMRMGFSDFVQERRAQSTKLFSDLKRTSRGYHSERMSRWFNEGLLPKVNAKTDKTSFHSFRHCFRDALRNIDAPPAVVQGLGGWETEGGVSGGYPPPVMPDVPATNQALRF